MGCAPGAGCGQLPQLLHSPLEHAACARSCLRRPRARAGACSEAAPPLPPARPPAQGARLRAAPGPGSGGSGRGGAGRSGLQRPSGPGERPAPPRCVGAARGCPGREGARPGWGAAILCPARRAPGALFAPRARGGPLRAEPGLRARRWVCWNRNKGRGGQRGQREAGSPPPA